MDDRRVGRGPELTDTQQCGRCKQHKPPGEYSPSYHGKRGTWCKSCFAAYSRGDRGPSAEHESLQCTVCGECYIPRQLKANWRYCSPKCKNNARNAQAAAALLESKTQRPCLYCAGVIPQNARSNAIFCSPECNSKAHALQRKMRSRSGSDDAPGHVRAAICVRDGWRCGICHHPVDRTLRHPDLMCASLDHIIPVSYNGTHDASNLRLTHLICNLRRGNTPIEDIVIIDGDTRVRDTPMRPAGPAPDEPAPCARCHEAERVPGKSYCKACVSLFNKEARERRKQRELTIDPHRYDPASNKPCARCKEAPREVSSYCRSCFRILGRESYARIGGKKPQERCSDCGEPRTGKHPSYCIDCAKIRRLASLERLSDKLCARCNKVPRVENTSYCGPCRRAVTKESRDRRIGKGTAKKCTRCGNPRTGKHPHHCLDCRRALNGDRYLQLEYEITAEQLRLMLAEPSLRTDRATVTS